MNLDAYFARIGYTGPVRPTLTVLNTVHRLHVTRIAYENIDVVLERPVDQNVDRILDKIAVRRRGGWCYEMNGLLGWALTEIGFAVERRCGAVMRAERGDAAFGNHLMLVVDLDGRWLADTGLGDGIVEPIRLERGVARQRTRAYRLEELAPREWRFHNPPGSLPSSFDFRDQPADETLIEATCANAAIRPRVDVSPESDLPADGRGRRWLHAARPGGDRTAPTEKRRLLASADELRAALISLFGIDPPAERGAMEALWQRVTLRHDELFGDTPVDEIRFGPPESASE